jgi:peptide chain release factor 3
MTWPLGDGSAYAGLIDRTERVSVDVPRMGSGGGARPERVRPLELGPPDGCPSVEWQTALDELELLDHAAPELDRDEVLAGGQTPVYFGSALMDLGVRRLLDGFAAVAPAPQPALTTTSGTRRQTDAPFSGFVFKIQANTDPRHRDRIAFLRVTSGRFRRGMTAVNARTQRPIALRFAHELFGRERATLDDAVAGDIVGIVNASGVLVGDTLYEAQPVAFPPIPTFAPERFCTVRCRDMSRYKRFRSALVQLDEEGVVHVYRRPGIGDQEPILAAVGDLQFEVARYRFEEEFGCPVDIRPADWITARAVRGATTDVRGYGVSLVEDSHGRRIALFRSAAVLRQLEERQPGLLESVGLDPADVEGLAA